MQSTMLSNKLSASTVAVAARPSRQRVVKTMAVFDTEEKKANKTTSGVGTKTRNLQMSGAECESVCCCLIQHRPARIVIARASTLPKTPVCHSHSGMWASRAPWPAPPS